ncbi:MAG: hypothetical protein ACQERB_16550 [Promethearchaeati archaeon]
MIRLITQTIANWTTIIIAPIMTILVANRFWQFYKETKKINYIRLIISLIFFAFTWAIIPTNLSEVPPFDIYINPDLIGTDEATINSFSIAIGFMVTFSLCMIAYANRWETLYYVPLLLYAGIIFSYLLNDFSSIYFVLNQIYIYVAGIIGLIFFYITGIKLKDNGSLGLGIFFTFAYGALAVGENIIGDLFTFLIAVFGIIFALGFFNPYKQSEVFKE